MICRNRLRLISALLAAAFLWGSVPVSASIDTDAYERIMGSKKSSEDGKISGTQKAPQLGDLPVPPIKKGGLDIMADKPAAIKKSKPAVSKKLKDDDDEVDDTYILEKGDVLTVKIYPEDEYIKGGQMEVSSEGTITLALLGKVELAGKNLLEAQRYLVELIDRDYLVNPEVVIQIEQHKKQNIVILGQVRKPGPYELPSGSNKLTLLQAIALAGGFTEVANIKRIKIVRQKEGKSEVLSANADAIISGKDQDIEIESGDAINVSESLF